MSEVYSERKWEAMCEQNDLLLEINELSALTGAKYVQERTCKNNYIHIAYGFICSECDFFQRVGDYDESLVTFYEWKYCPGCGARVVQ